MDRGRSVEQNVIGGTAPSNGSMAMPPLAPKAETEVPQMGLSPDEMKDVTAHKGFGIVLPPGKESPDGFDKVRHTQGFGDYHGFPADSDLGRAFAHYKDGMDEYDLADKLNDEGVFMPYFHTKGEDGDFTHETEDSERERRFCLDTAFTLFNALESIRNEVEHAWKPEHASGILPGLPRLTRATT